MTKGIDMENKIQMLEPQDMSVSLVASGGTEMLRVAKDGFYVRGVKLPQDEAEARAVYEAFIEWMTAHDAWPRPFR